MLGVSSVADFNNYTSFFSNTMQSFRQLTDPAKLNRQPERVRIKTVAQGGTLEQSLRRLGVPDNRLEEMAILNGMSRTQNLTQGTLIKIVSAN
jgi:predicted Zn-dependent protease